MKVVLISVLVGWLGQAAYAGPPVLRAAVEQRQPGAQDIVTLINNTRDVLVFQLRYNTPGAQWASYQLVAGERKVLSVKGTYLSLYMSNTNKQPLTYSLQAGNTYQFYWSVPRSMYDVDLVR